MVVKKLSEQENLRERKLYFIKNGMNKALQ